MFRQLQNQRKVQRIQSPVPMSSNWNQCRSPESGDASTCWCMWH